MPAMPTLERRGFLGTLGLLAAPIAAEAQRAGKVGPIGYLATDLTAASRLTEASRRGLRDLGYVEGRDVVIEYRDAEGKSLRLPARAAELVALKVDVIVTATSADTSRTWRPSTGSQQCSN